MAAGSRDHLQPNQVNQHHDYDHDQHFQHLQHFPHSRSLSLHTRFGGPTDETPNLTTKRSLLHRARRSVLSFSSPSPQASESPHASKRPRQDELYQDRPDVKRTMPSSLAYSGATRTLNDNARSLNGSLNGTHRGVEDKSSMDEGRPKNEDVFLNIARADSGRRDSIGRSDFRRVILAKVYGRQRQNKPPHPTSGIAISTAPCISRTIPPTAPYSSIHTPASSAHPLDDPNRFRYSSLGSGARSAVGVPRSRFSRTSPETSPRTPSAAEEQERRSSINDPRTNRHSGLSTIRSSRQPSASEVTGRPRADTERSRADGTESTLSTTAPSTVWDELDDLKDRIKKLELTGKLPPSSSAAMYTPPTNERPRTANTAITTLSSSPKQRRKASASTADTEQSPVHPILQSALAKAKVVLSGDVYTSLEATITDALNLSTALGVNTAPSGTASVVNGGYTSPERHARRKADSVCRSLTELCLALTDEQLKSARPSSSRETSVQPQLSNGTGVDARMSIPTYQRNGNLEPEGVERRHSTTRISSRLDARRASLVNASPGNTTDKQSPTQSPGISNPTSRLNRMSSSLRSRRLTIGEESGETESPLSRSVSRANTEIGTPLPAQAIPHPRQRFSQGHTVSRSISGAQQDQSGLGYSPRSPQYQSSQVPQPQVQSAQPRTPTLSSSLSFRRSYINPATYTPATSRSNIQAGSRRYGLTPSFSSNNVQGSPVEESLRSPQMEPSQTRISTPSSKVATSYTPIQTPRLRTNSLGARRFGLRNRVPATPNNVNLDDSID
ncbi:hypothetical protein N7449_002904 [Penicillium cf. viridicatum]|uniref:LPXTG-motif cell wall anchor domain protein n=1 Tax=Penicillium cf. viridicatum TaxID=2972119 RepID=A0A9W9MVY1_9EURO|nr:hypothetical protein N7449_002904 [Penicillium cf. viridicatum]